MKNLFGGELVLPYLVWRAQILKTKVKHTTRSFFVEKVLKLSFRYAELEALAEYSRTYGHWAISTTNFRLSLKLERLL